MIKSPSKIGRRYGWKPPLPKLNDLKFSLGAPVPIPRYINHYSQLPPVWDQGSQGSCTAHGNGAGWCQARAMMKLPFIMPSRSFIYYGEREEEDTISTDSGASVSDGIDVMSRLGVPPEGLCPYDPHNLMTTRPAPAVYTEALKHRAINAGTLTQDLPTLFQALAQGYCFVFGFTVYENFEDDMTRLTGVMSMPSGNVLGGHCVLAIGKNSKSMVLCRNSWGPDWGDPDFPGHFWMQPAYISNPELCADFRVVKAVLP